MINEVARRFGQCAETYDCAAPIQHGVAERLSIEASQYIPHGAHILEIGCGTGALTQSIARIIQPSSLTINDISPEMVDKAQKCIMSTMADSQCHIESLVGDAEQIGWPMADAIVSSSAVQWFKNPLFFITKAKSALPKGGVVAIATYGPMTFNELRSGAPNDYPSLSQWTDEFSNSGFQILSQSEAVECQSFNSRMSLLRMVARSGIGGRRGNQSTAALCDKWQLTWHELFICAQI